MIFCFTQNSWEDYLFWQDNGKKTRRKINELLKDISRNGANVGIGKPEPLTRNLSGFYSRRIDEKNVLLIKLKANQFIFFLVDIIIQQTIDVFIKDALSSPFQLLRGSIRHLKKSSKSSSYSFIKLFATMTDTFLTFKS